MPGLNQLKKFAHDIDILGNEVQRRTEKEETIPKVDFPADISDADDSDEFLLGLPEQNKESDSDANNGENLDLSSNPVLDEEIDNIDVEKLLAEVANESNSINNQENQTTKENIEDSSLDFTIPGIDDNIDLSALDSFDIPEISDEEMLEVDSGLEDVTQENLDSSFDDFSIPEFPSVEEETGGFELEEMSMDIPEMQEEGIGSVPNFESQESFGSSESFENFDSSESFDSSDSFDSSESFDFTPDFEIPNLESENLDSTSDIENNFETEDFSVPDFESSSLDESQNLEMESIASEAIPDFDTSGMDSLDFSIPDVDFGAGLTDEPVLDSSNLNSTDFGDSGFGDSGIGDFSTSDFSMPDADLSTESATSIPTGGDISLDNFEVPDFDVSNISEFSDLPNTDVPFDSNDFENIDNSSDSFDDFSDFDLVPPEVPQETKKRNISFSAGKGKKEEILSTELTEEQYKIFLKNLNYYPLNLRIEIEEMIVGNEFNDDIVMEVVHKIIKNVPARQLAGHVEKLVDKSIPVPLNYEKRTVAEYEAYQQSFQYKLKNKILPFTLLSIIVLGFVILFGFLTAKFVVTPVRANTLYKEGYTLLENGLYPQSELKFLEAESYKPMKKWYFNYARGYVDNKQYERASSMYERLLYTFDYDLEAGLEYATMELEERVNYSKAEEILKRYVLDYHINSSEGLLLLGDTYLEWATNRDPSKFEDARLQYANLIQLYGQKPLYLSRMMRYFIRTDNLAEVLNLKEYFYPKLKKDVLEPVDLVELSGYLLEKLYGELPAKENYLRASIENVRELLELAVTKAPDIPEAYYNYGRYFVETKSRANAKVVLEEALKVFANTEKKTQKRLISQIDTYRLLGELCCDDLDYLKAENYYVDGLTLFENERDNSGLESDQKIGLLYADLANLDYFISGNFDAALSNYLNAIENYNDNPSIRYRVGYIQYSNENFSEALGSFIKAVNEKPSDKYLLLALGNTLTLRNSTSAAQGYYEKLIDLLDLERNRSGTLKPQANAMDGDLVELYMKTANNLGVVLSLRANQTGNSNLLPKAMANFEESIRAFDALTRNQNTMIRIQGSNLASYNQKYLTYTHSDFEPSIYTELSPVLEGERIPEKSLVK